MSQEWYQFPVTQGHGQQSGGPFDWESGIDLGTPDNTPVYFPFDCQVIDASWQTYGGQVACAIPGQNVIEYFIHLNQIDVQTGDTIQAGSIVGATGGGVGDMVLHNGVVQPAQQQNWFVDSDGSLASTGPHLEFGEFVGSNVQQFNSDWNIHSNQIDPTQTINQLLSSGIGGVTTPSASSSSSSSSGNCPSWCKNVPEALQWILSPCVECVAAKSASPTANNDATNTLALRITVGLIGVLLIGAGVMGIVHGDTVVQAVVNPVGTVAKKAA